MEPEKIREIAEKAFHKARDYEKACTGCAQTTFAGVMDTLGIESQDAFKGASGLADGVGLTGDGTCGALIGGAIAIGLIFGRERKDFSDPFAAMKSYLLVKELYQDFLERYGTARCCEIQKKLMGRTFNLLDPKDLESAMKFGMMEHCSKVVGNSARKTVEIILKERDFQV